MARINKVCPGDCSKCEILKNGEVEMTTCVLDQIFQRVQKVETSIAVMQLQENEVKEKVINLVGGEPEEIVDETEE